MLKTPLSKKIYLSIFLFHQDMLLQAYRLLVALIALAGILVSCWVSENSFFSILFATVFTKLYLDCFKVLSFRQKDVNFFQKELMALEISEYTKKDSISEKDLEYNYFKAMQDTFRNREKSLEILQQAVDSANKRDFSVEKSPTRNKLNNTFLSLYLLCLWAPVINNIVTKIIS